MIGPGIALVVAAATAAVLDAGVGEPPAGAHPVALLGRAIGWLEPRRFGVPRLAGAVYAAAVPIAYASLAYAVVLIVARTPVPLAAPVAAGLVLWVSSSLRLLLESGRRVIEESETDIDAARASLPALAGREAASLSPELLRSAAVESLAENLSDGLVAPLFAFVALSLVSIPAAAAAAAFVKAVNTMDSMLGYPGAFGWASARLDDLVMFVPARVSAVCLGPGAGAPDAPLRARRYAHKPASPNAGWPMGTLAAALNVRLEKPGVYVLNDVADYPTVADGKDALVAVRRGAFIAYGVAVLAGVIRWL